ncbi:MAG: hypothetical protein DU429_05040 [Candidatus Tokpelaia sp.]|nr:MAG: hypothetical protein DU429_05040 [Candidatus Tokpelaia sp.]
MRAGCCHVCEGLGVEYSDGCLPAGAGFCGALRLPVNKAGEAACFQEQVSAGGSVPFLKILVRFVRLRDRLLLLLWIPQGIADGVYLPWELSGKPVIGRKAGRQRGETG